MRLLNTNTYELSRLFVPNEVPDYVILSHRWRDEEVTFEQLSKYPLSDEGSPTRLMKGFLKLEGACKLARDDGYQWVWIDTCCIDKSSSAELQESVNSMWRYYSEAIFCYVYMDDILNPQAGRGAQFGSSEWFQRGWTLQELIAPKTLEFYAANWKLIGTKLELCQKVSEITHISQDALKHTKHTHLFNAAEKLSWASHRLVTRDEDESYCLLGLFDINMPLLYGEGRQKAFIRLQEAIYRETSDSSLFFFRTTSHDYEFPLLADSPGCFCSKIDCTYLYPSWTPCSWYNSLALPRWTSSSELIISRYYWARQIHNQLMVKRSQNRLFASVELQVLPFRDVTHQLVYLDDHVRTPIFDEIAVLEYTLETYPNGALCMLLRRNPDRFSHSFFRATQELALVPDIRDMPFSLVSIAAIVSPVLEAKSSVPQIQSRMEFRSVEYHLENWRTHNYEFSSTHNEPFLEFEGHGDFTTRKNGHIDCYLHKINEGISKLCIQVVYRDGEWRVKDVLTAVQDQPALANTTCCDPNQYAAELLFTNFTGGKKKDQLHSLESTVLDRYIFGDSSHGLLEIRIRRRPALQPDPKVLQRRNHRYELMVERLRSWSNHTNSRHLLV